MRTAWIIALTGTLAACGGRASKPAPGPGPDPGGGAVWSTLSPERREHLLRIMPAVETYVRSRVDEYAFPAAVVGVVAGGELLWWTSYGNADLDTVFRIGSITKPITAAAVLALRDEGALDLDDPVERYLPELAELHYPTKDSPRITIRHLLTHTSGIGMNTKVDYWSRPDEDLGEDELFDRLDGFELIHVPGTKTVYSNVGMGLAGLVVQRASGMRYRDYVDRELLAPLGMTHGAWTRADVPEARLSTGSRRVDGMRVTEHHWRLGAIEGMGGLYSSLRDMSRFVAWQLSAWPPSDLSDNGPLARSSVRESHMVGGHAVPGRHSYGMGWRVRNDPDLGHVVSHVGGTFQYSGVVWMLTERDLGVILLTNDGYGLDKVDHIARNVAWIIALHDEN